jgi:hypothetical protein
MRPILVPAARRTRLAWECDWRTVASPSFLQTQDEQHRNQEARFPLTFRNYGKNGN